MSPGWPALLLFAALAGGAALGGVWLMVRHEAWARRHAGELITFASGLLVSGSLLHLLSRAGEMAGTGVGMAWALVAFAALHVAENHFLPHPHARAETPAGSAGSTSGAGRGDRRERVGPAVILGLGLHSVLDGIAVGAGFSAGFLTGGVIVALVVSHKLPVGIASMGILYHGGVSRRRAARYSAFVALLTPAAVIVAYAFLRGASPSVIGAFVAAAGGSFLYVGAADLLPEGQASGHGRTTVLFLSGVAVMVAALVFLPHGGG